MSKGAGVMKSKKYIKIMINIVSIVIFMFTAGCSNTNTNPDNEQSSASSGNSENNKPSNAASQDAQAKDADLSSLVAKIAGDKITIIKIMKKTMEQEQCLKKDQQQRLKIWVRLN